jgi:hypothetical protein
MIFGDYSGTTTVISLIKDPENPGQTFERQNKLLKDAFID